MLKKVYLCMDCTLPICKETTFYGGGRCQSCDSKLKNKLGVIGFKTGRKHYRFKGKTKQHGYVFIYAPNHPNKNSGSYVLEHRLVMEKKLGRYLKKKEIVHHLNGIRDDNRPTNLTILSSKKNHSTWTLLRLAQKRIRQLEESIGY